VFLGATDGAVVKAWLENMAMCFTLHGYNLQHKGTHGGLSAEAKRSSLVEDIPTSTKHGHQSLVMGTVRGMVMVEVIVRGIH
jgi:hypothetical protein